MLKQLNQIANWPQRGAMLLFAIAALILVFVFQHFNYLQWLGGVFGFQIEDINSKVIFSINKTIRFIINDGLTILIIYAIFYERKYVVFAVIVQLFGFLFLLPSYLIIKWHYPSYNGAMINYLHRLTINPVLLMLLIPVFMLQKKMKIT